MKEILPMRLILANTNPAVGTAFMLAFEKLPDVEFVHDGFESVPAFDCMVSAANSFGLMDGGVDAAIIRFFGVDLERRIQQYILSEYLGEQPVGTSFIIATSHLHPGELLPVSGEKPLPRELLRLR